MKRSKVLKIFQFYYLRHSEPHWPARQPHQHIRNESECWGSSILVGMPGWSICQYVMGPKVRFATFYMINSAEWGHVLNLKVRVCPTPLNPEVHTETTIPSSQNRTISACSQSLPLGRLSYTRLHLIILIQFIV